MLFQVFLLLSVLHTCLGVDLTYYVEEGKSPGTYIGDIAADSHLLDNIPPKDHGLIRFIQLQLRQTGNLQLFQVSENSGKLYTTHVLDTETMCKRHKECYKTVDVAVQQEASFMKILEIKVVLNDINDHQPEFPDKEIHIQFSENDKKGTKILIPNAIDRDAGVLNSQITYELKKNTNDPFTLSVTKSVDGTSKLCINLEEMLDREVKDFYTVQVIAKDGGKPPKQSVLDVHISVTDVNDNFPTFSQKVYNISVKNEPSETLPIIMLSASDADSGMNGRISYQYSPQTSDMARFHFKLNKITGEIFLVKKFTFGQELLYELYVEATDGGTPSLSSIAMVLVNVINQQNNAPTIDVNFVSASDGNSVAIPENIKVGSFIAYMKVTDNDLGENGEVTCDLHHDKFQLQKLRTKKYKIIIKNPLDRELQDYHEIIIVCQDKGSPPLRSERKFSIQVMDVNDVVPVSPKKTFKFWIYENRKSKFPVGYINATDHDLGPGGKLTYTLLSDKKHFLPFEINEDGLITTLMSLDHEFQDVYKFQVLVRDNGMPSLNNTVDVIVKVIDENDNAPYFTFPSINPYTFEFTYYPHHTRNITVLKASDKDSRENAFLKYEITSGNDKQLFTINPYTGLLSFTRDVTPHDAHTYELEFVVKDSGTPVRSATTVLNLVLTVSNKTVERPNVGNIQSSNSIHMYLLIVIVSVAVSVSVIITACITICYIRCMNRRNSSQRGVVTSSNKFEQVHLMYPSYLATSCSDVPQTAEPDKARNIHLSRLRRESHPGYKLDNRRKRSDSGIDLQLAQEAVYQEIGTASGATRRTFMFGERHKEVSVMSYHNDGDSIEGRNKRRTTHDPHVSDQYSSHYSLAYSSWIDPDSDPNRKALQQRQSCPGHEARVTSRCLHKPNNSQSSHSPGGRRWTGLKSFSVSTDTSRPNSPSCNRMESPGYATRLQQLPPLPHSDRDIEQSAFPKYYVLEPNSQNSPSSHGGSRYHQDHSAEVEHSLQLPLPKYYVLEPNTQTLPRATRNPDAKDHTV